MLQKRLSGGLQYSIAYTYSKCMSDAIGYYGAGGQSASQSPYWQNLYDKKSEWGPCFYDVAHVGTANVIYDLPVGSNRQFGRNMNAFVNGIVGEWQISGIVSLHTGFPHDDLGKRKHPNRISRRPRKLHRAGPCVRKDRTLLRRISMVRSHAYAATRALSAIVESAPFGGLALHTLDMSLVKQFFFTEHQNLEIRGEAINLTNTPILNAPNTGLGSNLGVLQNSQGARNVQLGLKYSF